MLSLTIGLSAIDAQQEGIMSREHQPMSNQTGLLHHASLVGN